MALDTTVGGAAAESYATVAEADTYHSDRGNDAWTGATSLKEEALRRATTWLDAAYRDQWPGLRTDGRDQNLDWPRVGAADEEGYSIPTDEIPVEVKRAQMEAALREIVSPGSLSPDVVASQRVVREKVGPIETEFADVGGVSSLTPVVTIVGAILSSLVGSTSQSVTMVERA